LALTACPGRKGTMAKLISVYWNWGERCTLNLSDCEQYGPWIKRLEKGIYPYLVTWLLRFKGTRWVKAERFYKDKDFPCNQEELDLHKLSPDGGFCDPITKTEAAFLLYDKGVELPEDLRQELEGQNLLKRLIDPAPTTQINPGTSKLAGDTVSLPPPEQEGNKPEHPTLLKEGDWDLSEAGIASFKGISMPLKGAMRRILARLVRAKGKPVHKDHLKKVCKDPAITDGTLRGHLSDLNKHLRKYLDSLNLPPKPIRYVDPDHYELTLT
jgi:hypothetical protein